MKQLFTILLTVCMMIAITGCGTTPTGTTPTTKPEMPTIEVTENEQTTVPTMPTEPILPSLPTLPLDKEDADEEAIPSEPEDKTFSFKFTFTGDNMLASYKNQTTAGSFNEYVNNNEYSYFLEKVNPIFEADDFTIVNLENVFTDKDLKAVAKDHDPAYWYRSKTSNVNILTCSSVEGVSLANNHLYDYGNQGKKDTIATVVDAGLQYGLDSQIMYFEKNGFTIAVICHGLWGEWQADNIVPLIKTAEEKSDYQIIFYHGGKERRHAPEEWKQRASRKLVDNGADLVIGNHPHVLQPREIYNGVEIIYSLGNFCYGGSRSPENRTIIYQMELTISENLEVEARNSTIIPCYVYTAAKNNYQPAPIENQDEINKVLDFMNGNCDSPI